MKSIAEFGDEMRANRREVVFDPWKLMDRPEETIPNTQLQLLWSPQDETSELSGTARLESR